MSTSSNIILYQTDNIIYKHLHKDDNEHKDTIENECTICFKAINNNKKIIQFSCGHSYHYSCFNDWCKQSDHVLDLCISCHTIRSYTIIPKKKRKKKKETKEKKCLSCFIQ